MREEARFELAERIRKRDGVPLADVFSFLSGLYFRGKVAYGRAFAQPPAGTPGLFVITAGSGLVEAETRVTRRHLVRWAGISVDLQDVRYRRPLVRDARALAARLPEDCEV